MYSKQELNRIEGRFDDVKKCLLLLDSGEIIYALDMITTEHKKMFNKDAQVMAVHAGLECGIIGEKFPGMDMISFGPEMKNPHSPDERVKHETVERFWKLLNGTLEELA